MAIATESLESYNKTSSAPKIYVNAKYQNCKFSNLNHQIKNGQLTLVSDTLPIIWPIS
jgi:hypothetical protein